MKTTAIIVGAGQSTRMGMNISKQLIPLCGKETIVHTLTAFQMRKPSLKLLWSAECRTRKLSVPLL